MLWLAAKKRKALHAKGEPATGAEDNADGRQVRMLETVSKASSVDGRPLLIGPDSTC
jgi:hypothetical protein